MQSMFMSNIRKEILFRFSKHEILTSSNKLKLWYSRLFAVRFHFQERFVPSCDLVMQCVSVAGSLFCHYPWTGVSTSGKWGLARWCSLNYAVITSSTSFSLPPCNQCNFAVCSMTTCTHMQRQLICWKLKLVSAKWHLVPVQEIVLVLILSWGNFPDTFPTVFYHFWIDPKTLKIIWIINGNL